MVFRLLPKRQISTVSIRSFQYRSQYPPSVLALDLCLVYGALCIFAIKLPILAVLSPYSSTRLSAGVGDVSE